MLGSKAQSLHAYQAFQPIASERPAVLYSAPMTRNSKNELKTAHLPTSFSLASPFVFLAANIRKRLPAPEPHLRTRSELKPCRSLPLHFVLHSFFRLPIVQSRIRQTSRADGARGERNEEERECYFGRSLRRKNGRSEAVCCGAEESACNCRSCNSLQICASKCISVMRIRVTATELCTPRTVTLRLLLRTCAPLGSYMSHCGNALGCHQL